MDRTSPPTGGGIRARRTAAAAFVAAALSAVAWGAAARSAAPGTELPPPSAGGIETLDPLLRKLATTRRLLVIAAHPDDEDEVLLNLVSRRMGGEAAYLSLTRGDGGQNLIGDELGVGLGLIRTEELNAARRLDGARQYFTRAYDFGFSKSVEETFRFWPKQAILEDAVRVIRRFRPQVLVAIFSGTPRDGHGQHQASGIVAREAFRLAGDPAAFPELKGEGLAPWSPSAIYQTTWFLDRERTTMVLPVNFLEPLTGRTLRQIGIAARSLQRSQGTGALQAIGPFEARLAWIDGGAGPGAKDPFEGIDTSLRALSAAAADAAGRKAMSQALGRVEELARETRGRLSAADISASIPPLSSVLEGLRAARRLVSPSSPAALSAGAILDEKIAIGQAALACAAGVAVDALADAETVTPGETLPVTLQVFNGGSEEIEVESAGLESPAGFGTGASAAGKPVEPGTLAEWKLSASVRADAEASIPYFLRKPLAGAMYDWSQAPPAVRGDPFAPRPLTATVALRIGRAQVRVSREVTFRLRDEEFGEIRHAVRVVPKLEVSVEPDLIVWRTGQTRSAKIAVRLASNSPAPLSGRVGGKLPNGWSTSDASFSLSKKGDRAALDLDLVHSGVARTARFDLPIVATVSTGERFSGSIRMIDYQHIRPTPMPRESVVAISAMDLKLPTVREVGYVRGASDRVPEALQAVGVPIRLLAPGELVGGDLSRYDAIVVGPRAYETEPALEQANRRLLEYVRAGGLLIVQYQQTGFSERGYAPEKIEIKRPFDRVTDETAPVHILDPAHPAFTTPNRIGPGDWEGWIQERGLYFANSWAPVFQPLLSMADPGEPELKGSLLVATIGKGRYVYTGLAFFRELPAGVPGAYRLFANLLALGAKR